LYCAVMPSVESGEYYSDCIAVRRSDDAYNENFARVLWKVSERLIEDKTNGEVIPSQVLAEWLSDEDEGEHYLYMSKWLRNESDADNNATMRVRGDEKITRGYDVVPKHMWVDDSAVDRCILCNTEFTFTNRRHHCRFCGKITCYYCSKNQLVPVHHDAGGEEHVSAPERACDVCWCIRHWAPKTNSTVPTNASSTTS
jgi:hypothetical protein